MNNVKKYMPLLVISSIIALFVIGRQLYNGLSLDNAMLDTMAAFFIIFGSFKALNLFNFVEAFSMYDLVAQRSSLYAYCYPFIEISLGLCYLMRSYIAIANWLTLLLMIIGSIGVFLALQKEEEITCACLGAVFKIPMTYVSLAEDLIMGFMALFMLIRH